MTSNSFTRTGSYADLLHCWENEDYQLDGMNYELRYCEPISRDQAVDDGRGILARLDKRPKLSEPAGLRDACQEAIKSNVA